MQHDPSPAASIAAALGRQAEAVCRRYLPHGRKQGRYWVAGDLDGARGRSLFVRLSGPGVPGKWTDAATSEHGDLLDLIRRRIGRADAARGARRGAGLPRSAARPGPRSGGCAGHGLARYLRRHRSGAPPVAAVPRHRRHSCRGAISRRAGCRACRFAALALPSRASLSRRLVRAPLPGAGRCRNRRCR